MLAGKARCPALEKVIRAHAEAPRFARVATCGKGGGVEPVSHKWRHAFNVDSLAKFGHTLRVNMRSVIPKETTCAAER
jgi:hypothetical protein